MIVKDIRSLFWLKGLLELEVQEMNMSGVDEEFIEYKHALDWLKEIELREKAWAKSKE
jgi:hypothetical protein